MIAQETSVASFAGSNSNSDCVGFFPGAIPRLGCASPGANTLSAASQLG